MGFRFFRRINIIPGITLNVSKSGVSTSAGVKGAHVTLGGTRGTRTTVGIPGTGLSCSQTMQGHQEGTQPRAGASRVFGQRGIGSQVRQLLSAVRTWRASWIHRCAGPIERQFSAVQTCPGKSAQCQGFKFS